MPVSLPPIAVFDFDHTLTDRDSFLPFIFYTQGFWKTSYHLIGLLPHFIRYMVGNLKRQEIKEKIFSRFFAGIPLKDLQKMGKKYAEEHLNKLIKEQVWRRLAWHKSQGHRCLIASASFEFYLEPWAKKNGFESAICSQLELTPEGYTTGRLKGLNCWGPEKKRRLLVYLGSEPYGPLYVYGDSEGDKEILELANYPFYRRFS